MLILTWRWIGLVAISLVLPAGNARRVAGQDSPPISIENAARVGLSKQVSKRVYRMVRGPTKGELTLFDHAGPVEIVDDATLELKGSPAKNIKALDFALSADGKRQAWIEKGMANYRVEEPATGKTLNLDVSEHGGGVAFSPDGKWIAAGFTFWDPVAEGEGYSQMRLYDASGKLAHSLDRTGAGALRAFFSPNSKLVAVGNRNHETQIFEVESGKLLHTLDQKQTHDLTFSPDGKILAAAYVDGNIVTWNTHTGDLLQIAKSGCEEAYSIDFSPDGSLLASSGRKGKVVLWDAAKLTKLKELDAQDWVIQTRFSADGRRLLSAGAMEGGPRKEGQILVWEVK